MALWWFVYTAPTEDPFARFRADAMEEQPAGDSPATGLIETARPHQRQQ